MPLMLHTGGELIDHAMLAMLPTPEPTSTHHPLPHRDLVQMTRFALQFHGHEIIEEHHAIAHEGARYFGLMTLRSPYGEYTDVLGLRNSHDRTFPIGLAFGSRVFVCDNLAFASDHVIKRKHTKNSKRDLPGLVASVVEPLRLERDRQHDAFDRYQATELDERDVNHLIMGLYRKGAINVTRIADVLANYENPPFDWGDKTAWRLFNAVTYTLTGRVAENPAATQTLHETLDHFVH